MFRFVAGDFPEGTLGQEHWGNFGLVLPTEKIWSIPESINLNEMVENVEILTEENKHKLLGKAGWGLIGLATFGPAGALAGLLLGGKKKEIAFVCHLKDGKKFGRVSEVMLF